MIIKCWNLDFVNYIEKSVDHLLLFFLGASIPFLAEKVDGTFVWVFPKKENFSFALLSVDIQRNFFSLSLSQMRIIRFYLKLKILRTSSKKTTKKLITYNSNLISTFSVFFSVFSSFKITKFYFIFISIFIFIFPYLLQFQLLHENIYTFI